MAIPKKNPYERLDAYLDRVLPGELESGKSRGKATADIMFEFNKEPDREMFAPSIIPSKWGFANNAPASGGVDSDYQAILDYATTQGYTLPSAGQQILQNALVTSLKATGIWSELDFLYVMATDGDSDYARINWSNPGTFQLVDTSGTPVFDPDEGFDRSCGNYMSGGYIPATDTNNATLNSTSMFLYDWNSLTEQCSGNAYMGTITNNQKERWNGVNTAQSQGINDCTIDASAYTMGGEGFKSFHRSGTDLSLYINGVASYSNQAGSGVGALNTAQLVLGRDGAGGGNQSQMTLGIWGRGSALVSEAGDLNTSFTTYITSI